MSRQLSEHPRKTAALVLLALLALAADAARGACRAATMIIPPIRRF
jgi:hypothetical protein